MLRIPLAAGAIALSLAMPAFAQNTMSGGSMNSNGSMSSSDMSAMTCDQMMTKARSMSTSSSGAGMSMAQKEMGMAQAAKAKNDEAGCKMHMMKAMGDMK
jgi:hypothetical protein